MSRAPLHRDDGPAIVFRRADGSITHQAWYRNGTLLAERGDPAEGLPSDPDAAAQHEAAAALL